jgi:hypothetical protein
MGREGSAKSRIWRGNGSPDAVAVTQGSDWCGLCRDVIIDIALASFGMVSGKETLGVLLSSKHPAGQVGRVPGKNGVFAKKVSDAFYNFAVRAGAHMANHVHVRQRGSGP